MPKNALKRLQKIENDLKSVISIYEVSNKCNNKQEREEDKNATQFLQNSIQEVLENGKGNPQGFRDPQISPFNILNNASSITAQTSQNVYSPKSMENTKNLKIKQPISAPLSFRTSSTISEVSYVKTKKTENSEKEDSNSNINVTNIDISNTNLVSHSEIPNEKRESRNVITGKSQHASSRESSILQEYPDWLFNATSNWFDSIKHSYNISKDKCSSDIPLIPVKNPKNESRLQSPEEKAQNCIKYPKHHNMNYNKKDFSHTKGVREIKSKQPGKIRSVVKQRHPVTESVNEEKNKITLEKEGPFQAISTNIIQKPVEHENGQLLPNEVSKMIEKSNEKLEKMKISKELALDIAKHLKEKYDEIQQSKQELMEESLKFKKNNERLKNELKEAQMKLEELKLTRTEEIHEDAKSKKILEENIRSLKAKICELEKTLLEKEREIDEIQIIRLAEIKNELENKENQGREIHRLSNEKCQLLARNDELALLLNDRHLQMQYLDQKIRVLQEEVQTQEQDIKIKTKALQEKNTELESIRQNSTELEHQVKILKNNSEILEENQKNLQKRTEEYEKQAKSNQEMMNKLQGENLKLKTDLENEKDALLIKTKIIEDQQETIKQLKEKLEEAKSLLKEKESLQRILNTEREEKLELEEAVGRLKLRKEELKKKIKDLENDLILAPEKVALDLQKTQTILFELENQVYSKQKEWELQLHSLIREKEQACRVAEYATKKLIQISSEFQKQSQAHQRLCQILAETNKQ